MASFKDVYYCAVVGACVTNKDHGATAAGESQRLGRAVTSKQWGILKLWALDDIRVRAGKQHL